MSQLLAGMPAPEADRVLRTQGMPLPDIVRAEFESRFNADLSAVRLHAGGGAGEAARASGANAFTYGSHIVFGDGKYNTGNNAGRHLLAHELAHVVQQGRGGPAPAGVDRAGLERAGESAAQQFIHGSGPIQVHGDGPRAIARDASVPDFAKTEFVNTGPSTSVFKVDGVVVLEITQPEETLNSQLIVGAQQEGKEITVAVGGNFAASVRPDFKGFQALAARGFKVRFLDRRVQTYGELQINLESPAITLPPPPHKLNAAAKKTPRGQDVESAKDSGSNREAARAETPIEPQNAEVDNTLRDMSAELNEIAPLVAKLVKDATGDPKSHALNEYRYTDVRLQADLEVLRALLPFSGSRTKEVEAAIAWLEALRKDLAPATATATKWHEDNPCGESLGMWNERVGTELAGEALAAGDRGESGKQFLYNAGAFSLAFLDAAESMAALGFHETATAVSEAYTAGDISWNDGEQLLNSSADRAILIALVTRGAGSLFSRVGAATATALRIAPTATRFAIVAGGIEGGLTAATALATQALYTKLLSGAFNSPAARAIWNRGIPSGKEWAIAIPLSILFGSAGAVNALNKSNAKLVGQIVQTPVGEMEILKVTSDGRILLKPKGSSIVPPEPPQISGSIVYDGSTRTWKLNVNEPTPPVINEKPAVTTQTGEAGLTTQPGDELKSTSQSTDVKSETPPLQSSAEVKQSVSQGAGEEAIVVSEKPPVPVEEKVVVTEKPVVTSEEPVVIKEKPATPTQEPEVVIEKSPVVADTPATVEQIKASAEPQVQPQVTPPANQPLKLRAGSQQAADRLSAAEKALNTAQEATAVKTQKVKAAQQELQDARDVAASYPDLKKSGKDFVKGYQDELTKAQRELNDALANESLVAQERLEAISSQERIGKLEERIAKLDAEVAAELKRTGHYRLSWSESPLRSLEHSRDVAAASLADETKNLTKTIAEAAEKAVPGEAGRPRALANAEKLGLTPKDGVPIDVTTGQPMKPTDVWQPDHIVSRSELARDPRMARLTPSQRQEMWHLIDENFLPLTKSANGSKQGLTVDDWISARANSKQPLPEDMVKALRKADAAARDAINAKFKSFLGE